MRQTPILLIAALLVGCQRNPPPPAAKATPAPAPAPAQAQANNITGKLMERIDAPPYSYLKIQSSKGEVWAAVPETKIGKGAEVTVFGPMQMDNFESKTLKRKFDVVFFGTLEAPAAAPSPAMQHAEAAKGPADAPDVKVDKATGADARTVAEVHAQKMALKEKPVTIRGKVVKFTSEVMGKNWIHLRDGSGEPSKGDNDITITTKGAAKVGDVLTVKGIVRVNKDFGSGYTYSVIVEDAKITN
ncbi:MAG: nucleotide-binding protein [Acidobacteriota bacterium]|nr:nucleotide-binding protein [Acidobacteriota bacterium]